MTNLNDFNKYKKAKLIVKELTNLLKIVDLSIKAIKPYTKYTSVGETLLCLQDNHTILSIHLEHHQQVLKNKGSVENEA